VEGIKDKQNIQNPLNIRDPIHGFISLGEIEKELI